MNIKLINWLFTLSNWNNLLILAQFEQFEHFNSALDTSIWTKLVQIHVILCSYSWWAWDCQSLSDEKPFADGIEEHLRREKDESIVRSDLLRLIINNYHLMIRDEAQGLSMDSSSSSASA